MAEYHILFNMSDYGCWSDLERLWELPNSQLFFVWSRRGIVHRSSFTILSRCDDWRSGAIYGILLGLECVSEPDYLLDHFPIRASGLC
jgi:hypothetical protein